MANTKITTSVIADGAITSAKLDTDISVSGLTVDTNTLHVDATNNRVGIGTTSPSELLSLSSTNPRISLNDSDNAGTASTGLIEFDATDGRSGYMGMSGGELILFADTTSDQIIKFVNGSGESARFDASGNLLVGQTTASSGTVGTSLRADGRTFFCADDNYAAHFNRNTGHGAIAHFAKDDNIIGSISSKYSDLAIYSTASGHQGIRMHSVGILPTDNAGELEDNTTDLGSLTYRFKDLFLSGGAYIGGTGSANKLDDYEEGTWTPNLQRQDGSIPATFTTHSGSATYTKIGNMVNVNAFIKNISAGSSNGSSYWVIYNIPFAAQVIDYTGGILAYNSTSADSVYVGDASGNAILTSGNNVFTGSLSGEFMFNITFRVS